MKQIFLISGKAQHGKDTVAIFLKQKLSGKTLIIHNADYLKYMAQQYLGWDGEKDNKGRELLQWLGTDKVRISLNKPLFWIEKTCDVIDILKDDFDFFIIPDTRFRNEMLFPEMRFPVARVKVTRLNFESNLTEEQKNHISENDLNGFSHDYEIISDNGLDKLEIEVDKFLNDFLKTLDKSSTVC